MGTVKVVSVLATIIGAVMLAVAWGRVNQGLSPLYPLGLVGAVVGGAGLVTFIGCRIASDK